MIAETLRPATVTELADAVREASGGFRVQGAGRWLDAGHPVRAAQALDVSAFTGIRQYTPADLTISVGAATTLAELNAVTQAQGQWCPLCPWGDDEGSVGATIATATAGPFAAALGRPRDLVLGLECVDGRGRVIRSGGRVVKNVAGFDITRLMTGAWGTLGVITEVHLRLRALPAVDQSALVTPQDPQKLREFLRGPLAPLGAVMIDAQRWLLRIAGNVDFTNAAFDALRTLGDVEVVSSAAWTAVRREHAPVDPTKRWPWTPLALRVKRAFDPRGVLNPGLLGEPQAEAR